MQEVVVVSSDHTSATVRNDSNDSAQTSVWSEGTITQSTMNNVSTEFPLDLSSKHTTIEIHTDYDEQN